MLTRNQTQYLGEAVERPKFERPTQCIEIASRQYPPFETRLKV